MSNAAPLAVSVNIGLPAVLTHGEKEVLSGINKLPAERPILLTSSGIPGDGQADLVHHGGPDKVVCVYDYSRYAHFEQLMDRKLAFGAFGENVTTAGASEDRVSIGDLYRLGRALVQVSQPRQPCFKLAAKYGWKELPQQFQQTGYTGYYFRVLEEGELAPDDSMELVERQQDHITVMEANRIMYQQKDQAEQTLRLLNVEALSESWKYSLRKRLG
ncbi:MOSC domain-containing protein [Paenibacillus sp. P96]|uniref:MOSC domain-containing protein n=1 Tax=Paenibacillus zeirhizosphaerae TaxID=2987519 RepID=A0ABT9FLA0_9BACL|nr:MOSC domain-containing protein [Paenibacillus sp. P96]MDP4095509.1 MOSC domain-containing protein [Paenibacillus sp. P96]